MQPAWFKTYLQTPASQQRVSCSGAGIRYQRWASHQQGKPGLLFVHGHAAHCHWWDFIAPAFLAEYDPVAMDLSGHGDSDHRKEYSAAGFAGEIAAVCEAAGLRQPTLVGHSLGGTMVRVAAFLYPELFHSILLVDSVLPATRGESRPLPMPELSRRIYPTLAQGMARFRLRPPQPPPADYILQHIAAHSLQACPPEEASQATGTGYRFKLDRALFAKMVAQAHLPTATEMIRGLKVPVGFIYGKQSRFFPEENIAGLKALIDTDFLYGIDDAHHHVFLDQPLAFIDRLGGILEGLRGV